MSARMCLQLDRRTAIWIWIVILLPQIIAGTDHVSDSTIQLSRDLSSRSAPSSSYSTLLQSTIQYSTSPFANTLTTVIINPSRTLQTVSGNSIVISGTHVLTSSFTTLDNRYTSDNIHSPSFSNQNTDSSISSFDTNVESNSLETNIVSVNALDMTVLNTELTSSILLPSFNELSMSSVLPSSSDFINDNKLTESYTLSTFLTDSVISKSVINNIKSTRTYTLTSADSLDTDSLSRVNPSSSFSPTASLPNSLLTHSLSSEETNAITSQTSVVLTSNILDSESSTGINVPVNSTPSHVSSVYNIGQTGKSPYDIDSRMSAMITSRSDTYSARTSGTSAIGITDQIPVYTTVEQSHGNQVSSEVDISRPSATSLHASEFHSLSEDIASEPTFHQQVSMTTHDAIISPTSVTNTIFDSMQTNSPYLNALTTVNTGIISIISDSIAKPMTFIKSSSFESSSSNLNSLMNFMDTVSPSSTSHLDTRIHSSSSLVDLLKSVIPSSSDASKMSSESQFHLLSEVQERTPHVSTVTFITYMFGSSTSSGTTSSSKQKTTVQTMPSSKYSKTTSYTVESTLVKDKTSSLFSDNEFTTSLSEIIAVSSVPITPVEKSINTIETQFTNDVTTFTSVVNGLDSTQELTPDTVVSSFVQSHASNISPTTSSHLVSVLDNIDSISQNDTESSSSVVLISVTSYSSLYGIQTTVEEVISSEPNIGNTTSMETYFKIESSSAFYRSLQLSTTDILSFTTTTDSLISHTISSESTVGALVTSPVPTMSVYSDAMNNVSTLTQSSMPEELSKVPPNITETSAYVDTIVPLLTTSDLKSTVSVASRYSTDSQAILVTTHDAFASIVTSDIIYQSKSSWLEIESSDLLPSFESISSNDMNLLSRTFTPALVTSELQPNIDTSSVLNSSRTSLPPTFSTSSSRTSDRYTDSISTVTESHIKTSVTYTDSVVENSSTLDTTIHSSPSIIDSFRSNSLSESTKDASLHISTSDQLDIGVTTSSTDVIETNSIPQAITVSRSIIYSISNNVQLDTSSIERDSNLQDTTTVDYHSISTRHIVPSVQSSSGLNTFKSTNTETLITSVHISHLGTRIISRSGTSGTGSTGSSVLSSTSLSDSFGVVATTDEQMILSTKDASSYAFESDNSIFSSTNLDLSRSDQPSAIRSISINDTSLSTIITKLSIEPSQMSTKPIISSSSPGHMFSVTSDKGPISPSTQLNSQPFITMSLSDSTDVISSEANQTISSELVDIQYSISAVPTDSTIPTSSSLLTDSQSIIMASPTESAGFVSNISNTMPSREVTDSQIIITTSQTTSADFVSILPNSTSNNESINSQHTVMTTQTDSSEVISNTHSILTPSTELTDSQYGITASPTDSTGSVSNKPDSTLDSRLTTSTYVSKVSTPTPSSEITHSQHTITALLSDSTSDVLDTLITTPSKQLTDSADFISSKPTLLSDSEFTKSKYNITSSPTYSGDYDSNTSLTTPSSELQSSQQSILASLTVSMDVIFNTSIPTPSSELTPIHSMITTSPIVSSTTSIPTLANDSTTLQRSIASLPSNTMVIVSTSTLVAHLGNASSLTHLSNSSTYYSNSTMQMEASESSEVTETPWFTKSTNEVVVGTKSQQRSPITHEFSANFKSLSYSTNYIFTSAGSSLQSGNSLAYTGTSSKEVFKTVSPSSTLVTPDVTSMSVYFSSNMITATSAFSAFPDSMSLFKSSNSFASTSSSIIETMVTSFDTLEQFNTISVFNSEAISNFSSTYLDGSFSIDVTDSQNSKPSLNVSQHSGIVYSTLSSTPLDVSPNIVSTPPYPSVSSVIQSSYVVTTSDVFSTEIANSSVELNASTSTNFATDTVFDTTLIGTYMSGNSDVSESKDASILYSNYSSTIFPSSTLDDSILTMFSMFDSSESVSSIISEDVLHSSFDMGTTDHLDTFSLSTPFLSSQHLVSSYLVFSSTTDALLSTTSRDNSMLFLTDVTSTFTSPSSIFSLVSEPIDDLTISDTASSKATLNTVWTSESLGFSEPVSNASQQSVVYTSVGSTYILDSSSSSSRQIITPESVTFSESVKLTSMSEASKSDGFQSSLELNPLYSDYTHSSLATIESSSSVLVSSMEGSLAGAITSDDISPFSSDFATVRSSNLTESKLSTVQSTSMIYSPSITTTQFELLSTETLITTLLSSIVSPTLTVVTHSLDSTTDSPGSESLLLSTSTISPIDESELRTDQSVVTPSHSLPDSLLLSTPTFSPSFTEYSVTTSVVDQSAQSSSHLNSIVSSSSHVVTPTLLSTGPTSLDVESSPTTSGYLETQISDLSASTVTAVLFSTEVQDSSTQPADTPSHSPSTTTVSTGLTSSISVIITSSIAPVTSFESMTYSTHLLETISPTSASVFMTNDSTNSTMSATNFPPSINSTESLQSQNVSVGNETSTMFSITVTSSITNVTSSSILETVSLSSSVFIPTTEPPVTTTKNITNVEEAFWIRTVLKIQRGVNTTSVSFIQDLERRLAEAYNEAFVRDKLIKEGKFEPLQRRRRKKRFATSGEASVHIHDLSRHKDSSTVTVVYAVEKSGDVMTSQEAVTALQVLDDQELAIILRQVVAVKAETYSQTSEPDEPTTDDNFPLWMIGAIAGGAAGAGILIWIVVCIYCKCCKQKEIYEQTEPELTSILPEHPERKESKPRRLSQSPVKKPLEYQQQTSYTSLKKSSNYTIPDREAVEVIDERRYIETPVKREPTKPSQHTSPECSTTATPVLPRMDLIVPANWKKGTRRNSKNSIGPSIEELEQRRGSILSKERKFDVSQLFQSTVSEDSDSVKELIMSEKRKNKEALRDKYGQDMDLPMDTVRSYDDSDKIMLDMPNTSVPSFVIATGSPVKKKASTQRRHSEGNPADDGNLEKAKNRMHQLLDDAFSLITPREHESYMENDTRSRKNGPRNGENTTLVHSSKEPRLPFSGYTNPGYTHSSEYFEAWSPYRSSDQVALISMPHTLVSSVTKLGGKSDKRSTGSKPGKRPASNLDAISTKPTVQPIDNKKSSSVHSMTRDPPEPIRLRTKDVKSSDKLVSPKHRTTQPSYQTGNGKPKTSSLDSGLILNGSVTSLSKLSHTDLSHSKNESVEMKPMNQNGWGKIRNNGAPDKTIQSKDKVDSVQSVQPNNRTENLFQSLRNELNTLNKPEPETEDDINKKPIRRKNKKVNKPMTDIM